MWRRRRTDPPDTEAIRRARAEAQRAEEQRQQVDDQWPSVHKISKGITEALRRNHFGEQLTRAALRKASS